jgi:acyl-CoA synthetase (AMP-forming)/AMP-acid ligase II
MIPAMTRPDPAATLQELLLRAVGFPDCGLRLLDRNERATFLSWARIAERAAEVAGSLAALGIAPGERVALVYPTGAEFFDAFFGTLFAGAVPAPLYPPVRLGRLEEYRERTVRQLEIAGAVAVLADRRLAPFVGPALELARPRAGCHALGELPAGRRLVALGEADDLALVQFSSGTTVDPKAVALDQRAVLAQVRALTALWPDTPQVRHTGVSWLPLYHDMGLIGCVLPALERPSVLTLLPPEAFVARPALWLRALSSTRATISPAPNFAYALATERVRDEELEGVDLSAWRCALCGAETVVAATLERFVARFARWGFDPAALTPVYGLSEAALAVTFPPLGRGVRSRRWARAPLAAAGRAEPDPDGVEIVSVGRPLAGFRLELRGADGAPLGERRVGRIFVAGPSLFREYLGQPRATVRALAGGWLDTGDLGFLDADELYLTGRAKDVLIINGLNHAPSEVEQAVDAVVGVRRGCVAAVAHRPEEAPTERLLLFVERHREADAGDDAALGARCREAVAAATGLVVDRVAVLAPGTLPRTSSGKIRRQETLARHLAGTLLPPKSSGALAVAAALVRGRLALARARREARPR